MRIDSPLVDLVDGAGGNVGSVCRALERLGVAYRRVNSTIGPDGKRPVILPGVGSFGAVMKRLKEGSLDTRIRALISDGVPFLGICVGLQVLFESSEESPGIEGLCILKGAVKKFDEGKVPQIGWNKVSTKSEGWEDGYVYFVNSYYAEPAEQGQVLYEADYYRKFCAAVKTQNITAFQFHPEKSGEFGVGLLSKWLEENGVGCESEPFSLEVVS